MADKPDYVTVQFPGLSDIIRIPILDTPEYKGELVTRMRAAQSPVPQSLQWIPDAINYIDDAQDNLITFLTLALPILRRLPAALLPALGWILLANDLLNLATSLLATVEVSRFPKRDLLQLGKLHRTGRAARLSAASAFLTKRFKWLPFLLQAGQVSTYWTGYGIQLGTIMGAITDSIWALFVSPPDTKIRIIQPPPSDPIGKAARFLTQGWLAPYAIAGMEPHEKILTVASQAAAIATITNLTPGILDDTKLDQYGNSQYPGFGVWNDNSRNALINNGFSLSDLDRRPGWYNAFADNMYGAVRRSIATHPHLDLELAQTLPLDRDTYLTQQLYEGSTVDTWDIYGQATDLWEPLLTPHERLLSRMYHENTFPPWDVEACLLDTSTALNVQLASLDTDLKRQRNCRNYYWATYDTPAPGQQPQVVIVQNYRSPRWWPPRYRDRKWQLAWWLQLALTLKCGIRIPAPVIAPSRDPWVQQIVGQQYMDFMAYLSPLRLASLLVWGNAWSKQRTGEDISLPPNSKIPFCINDTVTEYPLLEGIHPKDLELSNMRALLPKRGELPDTIEADIRGEGPQLWDSRTAQDPTIPWAPGP